MPVRAWRAGHPALSEPGPEGSHEWEGLRGASLVLSPPQPRGCPLVLPSPARCPGEPVLPGTRRRQAAPLPVRGTWQWAGWVGPERSLTELQAERCLCSCVSRPLCRLSVRAVQPHGAPLMEGSGSGRHGSEEAGPQVLQLALGSPRPVSCYCCFVSRPGCREAGPAVGGHLGLAQPCPAPRRPSPGPAWGTQFTPQPPASNLGP